MLGHTMLSTQTNFFGLEMEIVSWKFIVLFSILHETENRRRIIKEEEEKGENRKGKKERKKERKLKVVHCAVLRRADTPGRSFRFSWFNK